MRNRVVSCSHQTGLVHEYLPTEDLFAYHEARARGGVGTIFIEATAVHPTGLLTAHTLGGYLPEIVPTYRRLADVVHDGGARLFVQLFHGGRELIASSPKPPAVAPSAVPSLRFKSEPRALSAAEIAELIEGYAAAARHAADGGLDGVEVSMAHGYLPAQFFSALSNRRGDRYGIAARTRFAVEVMSAIREATDGRIAAGARLSADELVPGGLGPEDAAEVAGELHGAGLVDFISLALGHSAFPRGVDVDRPTPAGRAGRDRRSGGRGPPGRPGDHADRDDARRRPGARRPDDRRRRVRPRRADPRPHRRPGADRQNDCGPRRHRDRVRGV